MIPVTRSKQDQFILHWNVRGLISKCAEFKHCLTSLAPLLGSIQETHFRDDDIYNFSIQNYYLFTQNINSETRKGGVALYVSDSLVHRSFHVSSALDVVAAEVILNGKSITFISLYIPPGDDNFKIDDLRQLFNDVSVQGPFILLGDVNAHHSSWGSLH